MCLMKKTGDEIFPDTVLLTFETEKHYMGIG
jgi:hypothetical protein